VADIRTHLLPKSRKEIFFARLSAVPHKIYFRLLCRPLVAVGYISVISFFTFIACSDIGYVSRCVVTDINTSEREITAKQDRVGEFVVKPLSKYYEDISVGDTISGINIADRNEIIFLLVVGLLAIFAMLYIDIWLY